VCVYIKQRQAKEEAKAAQGEANIVFLHCCHICVPLLLYRCYTVVKPVLHHRNSIIW
jgi:hypothetical protein